jgi:hypothetical protein
MPRIGRTLAAVMVAGLLMAAPAAPQQEQVLRVSTPAGFTLAFSHVKPDGSMKMLEFVP